LLTNQHSIYLLGGGIDSECLTCYRSFRDVLNGL